MSEPNMREQIAITLALTDDLVSPPHGGRYYRYADAILPLIVEAVTAERERIIAVIEATPDVTFHKWLPEGEDYPSVVMHDDATVKDIIITAIRADREPGPATEEDDGSRST